jgi:hypothetical protein
MVEEQITKHVLKVIIKRSEDDEFSNAKWMTIVTSPKGITGIIECLWRRYNEDAAFGSGLDLGLDFYNKFPARRTSLIQQVLHPWDQVQGFKRVIYSDDIGLNTCEHLREYMVNGPPLNTIASTMEGFVAEADRYYEQKQYHLERDCYTAGVAYTVFRAAWVKFVKRYDDDADPNHFRHAARCSYLKAKLGAFKASLRLQIGYDGVATALECLMGPLRQHFQENKRLVGSPRQLQLNPAFCVKMVICRTLAYLALGRHINADQLQAEIDYWMEDSTYGISTTGSYLKRTRLQPRVEKLDEKNLKELEMHQTLGFLSMPGRSDLDLKLGSLWEWLEYPEEVFVVLEYVDRE